MTVKKAVEYILPSLPNLSALHLQLLLISLLSVRRTFGKIVEIAFWSSPAETAQNSVIQLNGFFISILHLQMLNL